MKKILIINGPNLNLLGNREKKFYGDTSLERIRSICEEKCSEPKRRITLFSLPWAHALENCALVCYHKGIMHLMRGIAQMPLPWAHPRSRFECVHRAQWMRLHAGRSLLTCCCGVYALEPARV